MPSAAKAVLILDSLCTALRPYPSKPDLSAAYAFPGAANGWELLKGTGFRPSVNLPNDTRL